MPREGDNSPIGTVNTVEPLTHFAGNTATGGVWRVRGDRDSAVVKLATSNGEHETQWNYWRREPLAFGGGFLAEYCGDSGITTPRLLETVERRDGAIELWLEDLVATPGEQWSVERLGTFAGQLGAAQARWTGEQRLESWLSRRFLRRYAGRHEYDAIDWRHPTAVRFWPEALLDGLRRLWERRSALFSAAEQLPRTVCHLDVWPKNLFARDAESVLIDWAFLGHGAVGEDIGNLIPDTVLDGLFDVRQLDEIRETVTDSYIEGYRSAGGPVPDADIRRAVALTGAAKYAWLAPMMLRRLTDGDSPGSQAYDVGSDTAEILRRRRPVFDMLVGWGAGAHHS
ncbi:MAG: phosphotransferase [Stackebrandtia sp.]